MFLFVATFTTKNNNCIDTKCLGLFTKAKDAFYATISYLIHNKIIWYDFYDKIKYYQNEVEYLLADNAGIFDMNLEEGDILSGYFTTEDVLINNYYHDIYSKFPNKGDNLSHVDYVEKIIDVLVKSMFNNEDDLIKWCQTCCPYFKEKWNISITENEVI